MTTVHCPQCNRALNLPENREVEVVSCPLCKTTFTPPAMLKIVPGSMANTSESIVPFLAPSSRGAQPRSMPGQSDEDHEFGASDKTLSELISAGQKLRSWAIVALVILVGVGGLGFGMALKRGEFAFAMFVALVLCCPVGLFGCVVAGANALRKQRGLTWAITGIVVALAILAIIILGIVYLIVDASSPPGPGNGGGLLMIFFLLAVTFVVYGLAGGIQGVVALLRPGATDLFSRPNE